MRSRLSRLVVRQWSAAGLALSIGLCAAAPARAQFFTLPWELGPREVYRIAFEHGYTLVGPPARNGQVYIADATDERGRRMRLILDAQSGEIMQRFQFGPPRPPGAIARQGEASRVARTDPADPLVIPGVDQQPEAPRSRPKRVKPVVAARTPARPTEPVPVTSTPLQPAVQAPGPSKVERAPAKAEVPQAEVPKVEAAAKPASAALAPSPAAAVEAKPAAAPAVKPSTAIVVSPLD